MQKTSYLANLWQGIITSWKGLQLSIRHAQQAVNRRKPFFVDDTRYFQQKTGIVTLQYPVESLPVPDIGRYQLFNEIEDCIVCDKCAKVCPVDCIEIESIKATEQIGTASDGSPIRLYASKFDIDMAKCCYCGLCTTVCPTECLTMSKNFDYSQLQVQDMLYHFSNLSEEEAQEKIKLLEQFQLEKAQVKSQEKQPTTQTSETQTASKSTFKPKMKSKISLDENSEQPQSTEEKTIEETPPVSLGGNPKIKPQSTPKTETNEENITEKESKNKEDAPKSFKPKMKVVIKTKPTNSKDEQNT